VRTVPVIYGNVKPPPEALHLRRVAGGTKRGGVPAAPNRKNPKSPL
jgi:hypothetical protein